MVKWTDPAKLHLKKISDFISLDSKYYAKKVSSEIVFRTEQLSDMPRRGRIVPEVNDNNIRELFIYSYRIIYEVMNANIYVLAVVHMRQEFDPENIHK